MSVSVTLRGKNYGIIGDMLDVLAIDTDFRGNCGVKIWVLIYSRAIVLPEYPYS